MWRTGLTLFRQSWRQLLSEMNPFIGLKKKKEKPKNSCGEHTKKEEIEKICEMRLGKNNMLVL